MRWWMVLSFFCAVVHSGPVEDLAKLGINFDMHNYGTRPRDLRFPILDGAAKLGANNGRSHDFNDRPQVLFAHAQSIFALLQTIQSREGSVVLDCSLFVQVAAQIFNPAERGCFFVSTTRVDAFTVASLFRQNLAYLTPASAIAIAALQTTAFMNKGQWVMATGDGLYLGLTHEGPMLATKELWIQVVRDALKSELKYRRQNCESEFIAEDELVSAMEARGILEDWTIFSFPSDR